jgi:hypothetical protein
MRNINDYQNVIHGKILKGLKGRKQQIEPIPKEILEYIFKNSQDGILIDFENSYFYNRDSGVRIYKIGKNYNYDKIYEVFKRKENFTNTHIIVEYNSRRKKWRIHGEWK